MAEVCADYMQSGSVFDVSIAGFDKLRLESIELVVQFFTYSFPTLFQPYISQAQWTTIGEVDDSGEHHSLSPLTLTF